MNSLCVFYLSLFILSIFISFIYFSPVCTFVYVCSSMHALCMWTLEGYLKEWIFSIWHVSPVNWIHVLSLWSMCLYLRNHLADQSVCLKTVILQLPNAETSNTVPQVVENPNYKIIFLQFQDCNFSTVMNHSLNISDIRYLICNSQRVCDHRLRTIVCMLFLL